MRAERQLPPCRFQFEKADQRLPYPVVRGNLWRAPREMQALQLQGGSFTYKTCDLTAVFLAERLLLQANQMHSTPPDKPCSSHQQQQDLMDENVAPSAPATAQQPFFAPPPPPMQFGFRVPPAPIVPAGLQPAQTQQLVNSLVNQLIQTHQLSVSPVADALQQQLRGQQLALVQEFVRDAQMRRLSSQLGASSMSTFPLMSPLLSVPLNSAGGSTGRLLFANHLLFRNAPACAFECSLHEPGATEGPR